MQEDGRVQPRGSLLSEQVARTHGRFWKELQQAFQILPFLGMVSVALLSRLSLAESTQAMCVLERGEESCGNLWSTRKTQGLLAWDAGNPNTLWGCSLHTRAHKHTLLSRTASSPSPRRSQAVRSGSALCPSPSTHLVGGLSVCRGSEAARSLFAAKLRTRTVSFLVSTNALSEVHILCSTWNGRVSSVATGQPTGAVLLISHITWTAALWPRVRVLGRLASPDQVSPASPRRSRRSELPPSQSVGLQSRGGELEITCSFWSPLRYGCFRP